MNQGKQYTGKKRGPKPKKYKKVGFSTKFTPCIISHLQRQENQSKYLEGLIRDDIWRMARGYDSLTVDIYLFGAIPVTVEYQTYPADPHVGIMEPGVDDWEIVVAPDSVLKDELMEFITDLEGKGVFSMDEAIRDAQ